MEKVVYNEDTVFNLPTGAPYYEHLQSLRDELSRMEIERDKAVEMLTEVAEAESPSDLEEALNRVKQYIDNLSYPSVF
jgi:hypothetical protein